MGKITYLMWIGKLYLVYSDLSCGCLHIQSSHSWRERGSCREMRGKGKIEGGILYINLSPYSQVIPSLKTSRDLTIPTQEENPKAKTHKKNKKGRG